jgi:anti-anti-sigma factor
MANGNSKYVFKVGRSLDLKNSRELKRNLVDALENGVKQVELDFTDTESIDSSGLGKLLLFNEKFTESGGNFLVKNVVHAGVRELFQVINLDRFMIVQYKN